MARGSHGSQGKTSMRRELMTRVKRLEACLGTDAPSQAAIKSRASVGAKVDTLLAAIERGDLLPEPEGPVECSPSPSPMRDKLLARLEKMAQAQGLENP